MSERRLVLGVILVLVYVGVASALVALSYWLSPPTTTDQYKEFGVRAGIALTATAAVFGAVFNVFVLGTQIQAARDLEDHKKTILLSVEDRKKELQLQIEEVRGHLSRENERLRVTLSAKAVAYDKLFVATTTCYRELQNLARGLYDVAQVRTCARLLQEAEGLSANLDDEDKAIVREIMQAVFNVIDEADVLREDQNLEAAAKKTKYVELWNTRHAKLLGEPIERLQERSLFHNQDPLGGPTRRAL